MTASRTDSALPILQFPQECIVQLRAAWDASDYVPPYKTDGFPSADVLSPSDDEWHYLVTVCIAASLITDEARYTRLTLAFERNVEPLWGGTLGIDTEIRFDKPVLFTPREIAKLAHSLSDSDAFLWVRRTATDGAYIVSGIGPGWRGSDELGIERPLDAPPTSVPQLKIIAPSKIQIFRGLTRVAWLDPEGVHLPPDHSALHHLVLARCTNLRQKLAARPIERLGDRRAEREVVDHRISTHLVRAVEALVRGVLRRGHGGMIAVLPSADETTWSKFLRPKYPVHRILTHNVGHTIHSFIHHDLQVAIPALSDCAGEVDEKVRNAFRNLERHAFMSADSKLRTLIRTIASLSGVDGAVILRDDLSIWGFGVEIVCPEKDGEICWSGRFDRTNGIMPERQMEYRAYGTRHRSCFRLCREVPNALCFVVSQDGRVKVVTKQDEKVIFFDEVENQIG